METIRDGFAMSDENRRLELANPAYLSMFDGLDHVVPGVPYAEILATHEELDEMTEIRAAEKKAQPIKSPQALAYFKKGVRAAHEGDWRAAWRFLKSACESEPGNPFLESRFHQVDRRLRGLLLPLGFGLCLFLWRTGPQLLLGRARDAGGDGGDDGGGGDGGAAGGGIDGAGGDGGDAGYGMRSPPPHAQQASFAVIPPQNWNDSSLHGAEPCTGQLSG